MPGRRFDNAIQHRVRYQANRFECNHGHHRQFQYFRSASGMGGKRHSFRELPGQMSEKLIADFSGGMNASVAIDKLKDNECLLAENIRFDEQGNAVVTGANSLQNTSSLSGSVHSIFLDPTLGAIAGAGTNVYEGTGFSSLTLSTATNSSGSKMSFGIAPSRVYM